MQIKSSLLLITVCMEYIFPPFNLSVSLNVKWFSCRQHVVVGYLLLPCSQYDSLCLLIVVCESTHLIYFITSLDLDLSSCCLSSDHFIFSMFLFFLPYLPSFGLGIFNDCIFLHSWLVIHASLFVWLIQVLKCTLLTFNCLCSNNIKSLHFWCRTFTTIQSGIPCPPLCYCCS